MDSLETIGWAWVGVLAVFLVGLAIGIWIIIQAIISKISVKEAADRFWARWHKP